MKGSHDSWIWQALVCFDFMQVLIIRSRCVTNPTYQQGNLIVHIHKLQLIEATASVWRADD